MNALLFNFLMVFGSLFTEPVVTLKVEITNLKAAKGKLRIGIYKPGEKFTDGKPVATKILEVNSKGSQVTTFELEPGRYALALYHDLNGNEAMDKNFVGIPKEPYGFSKDFRPKLTAPSFEDCAFDLPTSGKSISVKLTN